MSLNRVTNRKRNNDSKARESVVMIDTLTKPQLMREANLTRRKTGHFSCYLLKTKKKETTNLTMADKNKGNLSHLTTGHFMAFINWTS